MEKHRHPFWRSIFRSGEDYFISVPKWILLIGLITMIYDWGFDHPSPNYDIFNIIYSISLVAALIAMITRYSINKYRPLKRVWFFDLLLLFLIVMNLGYLIDIQLVDFLTTKYELSFVILLAFFREILASDIPIKRKYINPPRLFLLSFCFIIFIGTMLLLLPNATHEGISPIDALFTSTSAVCVTGLIVVDTGSYFTLFGQTIILLLIQAGGLGIMTFTSYFSYFFKGESSYEHQLLMKDMTNEEKVGEVFSTLKKIIVLTLTVEAIGAILIFFSLNNGYFSSFSEKAFFSIFHTVSGFCNAGFSTLPNSMFEYEFRFNYPLHLIIAFLFIIGGIGFPIAFNFYKYLKYLFRKFINTKIKKARMTKPWILNINSRIVILTTVILLVTGTAGFYILEYNNSLAEHNGIGKIVTAFFGAATPRTAGFNSVDTSALLFPTILLVFLLMWIGASPGSTGGGIKTSTFLVATLNFLSLARGKNKIEIFRREISNTSIKRSFAVIALSLVVIGIAVFLISIFDSDKELLYIAFECFSAYSTVGLSLGLTGELSEASKTVIILTMFIGRVSMLTILIAFFKKVKSANYRYPTEEVLIN